MSDVQDREVYSGNSTTFQCVDFLKNTMSSVVDRQNNSMSSNWTGRFHFRYEPHSLRFLSDTRSKSR
jgi:hypothetical protein